MWRCAMKRTFGVLIVVLLFLSACGPGGGSDDTQNSSSIPAQDCTAWISQGITSTEVSIPAGTIQQFDEGGLGILEVTCDLNGNKSARRINVPAQPDPGYVDFFLQCGDGSEVAISSTDTVIWSSDRVGNTDKNAEVIKNGFSLFPCR